MKNAICACEGMFQEIIFSVISINLQEIVNTIRIMKYSKIKTNCLQIIKKINKTFIIVTNLIWKHVNERNRKHPSSMRIAFDRSFHPIIFYPFVYD